MKGTDGWVTVCLLEQLPVERAVVALVGDIQVAVVRLTGDEVRAVGHYDPVSRSHVMARGIVGSREVGGRQLPTLTSPLLKQVYDLDSGACLDDYDLTLGCWAVRVRDGSVEIQPHAAPDVPTGSGERRSDGGAG
ncbi:nitrite reductase small subunit NirD [Leekyejoonella antrihumi]|uniref:Nitrite reductase small subunit NirD n=1 Tax=Leekyejoonella antrihumi TaxID=1660198 RepID=A0A563E9W4_9MICO|nr:nitrite reductase small subunit NirD [Leekyejoonella antrihumi]TWP39001.1 nitrite reductase small subunit NirD [Leekyejoonella antrihumi]